MVAQVLMVEFEDPVRDLGQTCRGERGQYRRALGVTSVEVVGDDLLQDRVAVREELIDRRHRDIGTLGDCPSGDSVYALGLEQLEGCRADRSTRRLLRSCTGCRRRSGLWVTTSRSSHRADMRHSGTTRCSRAVEGLPVVRKAKAPDGVAIRKTKF